MPMKITGIRAAGPSLRVAAAHNRHRHGATDSAQLISHFVVIVV